jgi:hypothetical protein
MIAGATKAAMARYLLPKVMGGDRSAWLTFSGPLIC